MYKWIYNFAREPMPKGHKFVADGSRHRTAKCMLCDRIFAGDYRKVDSMLMLHNRIEHKMPESVSNDPSTGTYMGLTRVKRGDKPVGSFGRAEAESVNAQNFDTYAFPPL